jgi:hypothetical protein
MSASAARDFSQKRNRALRCQDLRMTRWRQYPLALGMLVSLAVTNRTPLRHAHDSTLTCPRGGQNHSNELPALNLVTSDSPVLLPFEG